MIVILKPSIDPNSRAYKSTLEILNKLPDVEVRLHTIKGSRESVSEVYLLGRTGHISKENIEALPAVAKVIRISQEYRVLGRHADEERSNGFEYNGLNFSQDSFHIFAGLCAVDSQQYVEATFKQLNQLGLQCTRMGAYKPRTSPYAFQGHGKDCLPYLFDLAGKYDIRCIAMEVTHERCIDEINEALDKSGAPCGVMLQIGTRNAQNFELLRAVGAQKRHPILFKRGYGISLNESLNATEYLANEGNHHVIFCLRGVKTLFAEPHRNLADFAHVPVIKRLTRMPVCIDPSHSVGVKELGPDNISDIYHASAQGVISGANMVLVDFHPEPVHAAVDSKQAIPVSDLEWFVNDLQIVREAYLKRVALAKTLASR